MMSVFPSFFSVPIARAVTISTAIPGETIPTNTGDAPGAMINGFYQFAIFIGGLLAFAIIVYAGVKYMASAGNPSGQSDAKEWIWSALLGLLLLGGAYMVLTVINPTLTTLSMPNLTTAQVTPASPSGTSCSSLSCPSGFLPTMGGSSCVCENATGQQGCGGGVMGTVANSCGSNETCQETSNNPITYACVPNSTVCGGATYGTCPAGQGCVFVNNEHICQ